MEKKEAMKILKDFHDKSALFSVRTALDTILPELRESEDERIRKYLIYCVNRTTSEADAFNEISKEQILAWLEKQAEHQKFRDSIQVGDKVTRNEDGVLVNLSQLNRIAKKDEKQGKQKYALDIEIPFGAKDSELHEVAYIIPEGFHAEIKDNEVIIKKGKQNPAWSEEDMSKVQRICKYLNEAKKYYADITEVRECMDWLKSLKQRHVWKPSEDQMRALHDMNLTGNISYVGQGQTLIELYNDLKKL